MILNKLVRKLKPSKQISTCLLCSKPIEVISETENSEQIALTSGESTTDTPKKRRASSKKHLLALTHFFNNNPKLLPYKELIPEKLLYYTPYNRPQYMYLISPDVAKRVANHILPTLNMKRDQVVAEVNPGFGFIAKELIKKGVPVVRLYENNVDFYPVLRNLHGKVELFTKDFFNLALYSHIDKFDQGSRVMSLLEGVPLKRWDDDPAMTVVGTVTHLSFVKYLIKSIVLQSEVATYGRFEIFALMFPKDWAALNSTKEDSKHHYRPWTILFEILFKAKLLDKFPRNFFLPWLSGGGTSRKGIRRFDPDNVYLIQISMRKDFCLRAEELVAFFCFIRTFLTFGSKPVIPTSEKWVPGCGKNLILPKLKHEDYFDDINVFTKFKELNPNQIVAIFKEISSLPEYNTSPFMDMVEQEMIKTETVSSDIFETHKYKKNMTDADLLK